MRLRDRSAISRALCCAAASVLTLSCAGGTVSQAPVATGQRARQQPLQALPTAPPAAPDVAAEVESDEARWLKRSVACVPGQSLSEAQNRTLDYNDTSELSVVRVAPADSLEVRAAASSDAASLGSLNFQETGLRQTGRYCNVRGVLWTEIEAKGLRGWANASYLRPTATPRDETESLAAHVTGGGVKRLDALAEQIRRALTADGSAQEQAGLDCGVKTVGTSRNGTEAALVFFDNCGGGDSISGAQYLFVVNLGPPGWRAQRVEVRQTCHRGAFEGLCR